MAYISSNKPSDTPIVVVTEVVEDLSQTIDIEKLGRQRPEVFSSTWQEVAFVISIIGSLCMADFVNNGFQVILPFLIEPLNIPSESQTWPSSVLTLVAGSFLFPLGRLADMYGGYLVFNGGIIWFALWTIIAGFSKNFTMLVLCRGMEGLGAAAFLPAGISLLGRIYRPGPRKNLVFSLYGAVAPLGLFSGIIVGGLSDQLLSWNWFFWIGGMIAAIFSIGSAFTAPRDYAEARKMNVKMDWYGVFTTIPGLMLVIYAITDSSGTPQGWAAPQILVTLSLGICFLIAAIYVEGWVAEAPLIPADIFRVPYMKRMLMCLFLSWGAFSVYLYYSNFYIHIVLGKPALLTAVWYAPWAVGGLVLSTTSGLLLHILPGRAILIMTGVCKVIAVLLFALIPSNPNYWAWVFPAMLAEAACVDVLWTVSNVFLTTSLPRHRQGLAGAVICVSLFLGGAFFLAIVNVAKSQFNAQGLSLKHQYKNIFWIGVGFAGMALFISFFVKIGKASSSLTVDEKEKEIETETESDTETVVGVEKVQAKEMESVLVVTPEVKQVDEPIEKGE